MYICRCFQSKGVDQGQINETIQTKEEGKAQGGGIEVAVVLDQEQLQQIEQFYVEAMKKKPANSWPGSKLPPVAGLWDSPDIRKATKLAEARGLGAAILTAREDVVLAVFMMQCVICTATGDSRTALEKDRPVGEPDWSNWELTHTTSEPGYELYKQVIDAIVALQKSKGVVALADLTSKLTAAEFATIPGEVGGEIPGINMHPCQDMGLQSAPLAGKGSSQAILLEDWTTEMHREMEGAIAKLKSGAFGNPATFSDDGRGDFGMIMQSIDGRFKKTSSTGYLIACGINRFDTFHGKGMVIVAAVPGADYSKGPIKGDERVGAKCLPGGDYYSADKTKRPNCMHVLDILRGTVTCTSHDMMLEVRAKAVEVFDGQEPAVLKDRRMKVQHDMLLVFQVEGMYCELQLHYDQTMCIKSLMHSVFEIERLTTNISGLRTIMEVPPQYESALKCKALLHI
jgi:hypothetical protein